MLLVRRTKPPYDGKWALPGGWVYEGNSLTEAALWQLNDKTSLRPDFLEQLYTFGLPDRDPREHRIAVTYFALVKWGEQSVQSRSRRQRRQLVLASTICPSRSPSTTKR